MDRLPVRTHCMNHTDNSDINVSFQRAAELVTSWGQAALPDGRTVEQSLTIEGISFWNAVSSMLAFGYLSQLLSHPPGQQASGNYRQTLAQKAKRVAFDVGMPLMAGNSGCRRWPSHPAFLFLGFSHHMYRETLQPVAARLARRADRPVVILDEQYPYQIRSVSYSEPFHSLWQHWDDDVARTARNARKLLKAAAAQVTMKTGLPEIVASSGLEWRTVHHLFDLLFDSYMPRLAMNAAIALHIMEHHRPALLISPDVNDPRTRILCLAGRLAGVKTLDVQFTFYGRNDIEWRFFLSDHLAVTGEANLQVMLGHGIPREKMTVTGSPRYDNALSWPVELAQKVRRDLKIPPGKVMVLFASQPFYFGPFSSREVRREMIRALFQATSTLDDLILVVKPHPLEDPAELASLAQSRGNILFADKRIDIRDTIKAADAFVTFFSSTTFDALVMNKPTINILFPGCCAASLFDHCGATFVARNGDEISRALHAIGSGNSMLLGDFTVSRERFLSDWFHQLDGHSAERIEALALKMASGYRRNE